MNYLIENTSKIIKLNFHVFSGDVVHMESTHFRKDGESKPGSANSTYDDVDLQNENNTYDGVHLQNENNTYDGVHLEDENPYYASN